MPYGILDEACDYRLGKITSVGDRELLKRIEALPNLDHFVGGHLHLNGGKSLISKFVTFHNAAICDEGYQAKRKPILIEY